MPLETKPAISSLAEMTCENCIYYQKDTNTYICINVNSNNWGTGGICCSEGKWLYLEKWQEDDKYHLDGLHYDYLYYTFAKAALLEKQNGPR